MAQALWVLSIGLLQVQTEERGWLILDKFACLAALTVLDEENVDTGSDIGGYILDRTGR